MTTLQGSGIATSLPADEWLLVIDMQRAFGADDSVWKTEGFWKIAPRIDSLLAVYGSRALMMRYVPPAGLQPGWRQYFSRYPSMFLPADDPAWDIVVSRPAHVRVETRATFSKWDAGIARVVGPDARLAVCGVATECCVVATVMAAIDEGRMVRVLEDACAGTTLELHRKAIQILSTFSPLVSIARVSEIMDRSCNTE